MNNCFLYPGQGVQYAGMGKDLYEKYDSVKNMFKIASEICETNMKTLLFDSDFVKLSRTDNTQPAITLVNLAIKNVLADYGIKSDGCGGHSLGEWAAYSDAGILTDEEVLKAVFYRGKYMHEAGEISCGEGSESSMAAVIGIDLDTVEKTICSIKDVYTANWNSPKQIVISGTQDGLHKAETALKESGARRVIRLKVSAPCHSPLLKNAQEKLADVLEKLSFRNPVKIIYSNVSGESVKTGESAKELALKQIVSPVLWVKEEENILKDKYSMLYETGPGKVLSGLIKSISPKVNIQLCGTCEQIKEIIC